MTIEDKQLEVWVIDDDDTEIFIFQKIIKPIWKIDTCEFFFNGQEAILQLSKRIKGFERIPDIIILDINMPIMNGWEFLENYITIPESVRRNITLIMASSTVDADEIYKATAHPEVRCFISKPIDSRIIDTLLS